MWSEEFDKKIKEAADLHHPAYQEDAWSKMEKKLDEHLPVEEKKKRRFIFWWFIPLLIATAFVSYKLINNKGAAKQKVVAVNAGAKQPSPANINNKPSSLENNKKTNTITENEKPEGSSQSVNNIKEETAISNTIQTLAPTSAKQINSGKEKRIPLAHKISTTKDNHKMQGQLAEKPKKPTPHVTVDKPGETTVEVTVNGKKVEPAPVKINTSINNNILEEKSSTSDLTTIFQQTASDRKYQEKNISDRIDSASIEISLQKENMPAADSNLLQSKNDKQAIKVRKNKPNSFFITASLAPDISFASNSKAGQLKTTNGFGIGYAFNDRFAIRAGFYNGLKVYTASGSSYKSTSNFNQYFPYLDKTEANCRIYEIPVSISYNFLRKQNQQLFASASLSSIIMKRETYRYYFRYTPTGSIHQRTWAYNNKNQHFLSMATLSAGYQLNLSKKLFITTEPYFKFPLQGIGAGEIKLNSAGVLFSAGFRLF